MKNLDKRTEFDKQWEDVFKDTEMAPSEGVWDKIDSVLSKEEAGYFRKRAFLYKLLAAASIAFALGVGLFSINYYLDNNTEQIAIQKNDGSENLNALENDHPVTSESYAENKGKETADSQISNKKEIYSGDVILAQAENQEEISEKSESKTSVLISNENYTPLDNIDDHARDFFSLSEIGAIGISLNSRDEMIYEIDHIYLIPIMPKGSSKKKKEKETGLFLAGLDFSTGVFDPNFQQSGSYTNSGITAADTRVESVNNQLASFNTANKDFLVVRSSGREAEPEIAFSYGAIVGFKVARRIILQTGIAYRKANTTTTTTGYVEEIGSNTRIPIVASYQYQLGGLSSVNRISETNLSNQYEFASIPLRAGYVFLDKKFNLTLMAGISSNFFLNNQIVDKSDYLETLSSSPGDGSPYKSVYFNGSLGTMLGYTISDNYVITLEPSYRFAVNSFTRDDFYLNSYPSSFMLSFGIAYNFK
ncbi:MAG: hypothetical protein KAI29_18080 [Cyclobacteriaceae bacterium]|nr:hypothetical protein [Cyclobacteriaceae bacterium]